LQNAPMQEIQIEGLTWNAVRVENYTAPFDLTLTMIDSDTGLRGTLVYNTDLFEAATIKRLATHFETLLEGIVLEPETMISSLPLLTANERDQLLHEWNQVRGEYQTATCLHEWFEQQARRNPAAVAVVCDQDRLTYRELNERANQLASYLRERGVGPEVMVGLYIERSLDL